MEYMLKTARFHEKVVCVWYDSSLDAKLETDCSDARLFLLSVTF